MTNCERSHARLLGGTESRVRQLALLHDVARSLASVLEPVKVSANILAAFEVLLPGTAARLWPLRERLSDARFMSKTWAITEDLVSMIIFPLVFGDQVHAVLAIPTREPHRLTLIKHLEGLQSRRIWTASEAKGRGSTYSVPLPAGGPR